MRRDPGVGKIVGRIEGNMGKALRKIAGEAFQPNVIFFGKQAKGRRYTDVVEGVCN
jgi:hypothetical protein